MLPHHDIMLGDSIEKSENQALRKFEERYEQKEFLQQSSRSCMAKLCTRAE